MDGTTTHAMDLLERFENALTALRDLHEAKRHALAALDAAELGRLAQLEESLTSDLQALTAQHRQLTEAVGGSLRQWAARQPPPQRGELIDRLDRLRKLAHTTQRHASSNWVTSYRLHQYTERTLSLLRSAGPGLMMQSDAEDVPYQGGDDEEADHPVLDTSL